MSRLHVWTRLESVPLLTKGVFQSFSKLSGTLPKWVSRSWANCVYRMCERNWSWARPLARCKHVEFNQFSQLPVRTDHFWSRSVAMCERDWKDVSLLTGQDLLTLKSRLLMYEHGLRFIHSNLVSCSLIGSLVNTQSVLKMSTPLRVLRPDCVRCFWCVIARVNVTSTDPFFFAG